MKRNLVNALRGAIVTILIAVGTFCITGCHIEDFHIPIPGFFGK